MKTRLLKRLRREAANKIPIIQIQMRDMGVGEDIFRIYYKTRSETNERAVAEKIACRFRQEYILRCVVELKGKRKWHFTK